VPAVLVSPRRALAVVLVVLLVVLLTACGASSSFGAAPAAAATGSAAAPTLSDAGELAPATPVTDLATLLVAQLPTQGVDTLRLIAGGGPYPYSQDGVVFSNREGHLPQHGSGWYHEYTVLTPGSSDRGARRIITGEDGARFYTDDHYASFREVLSGAGS